MSPGPPIGGNSGWKVLSNGEDDALKLVPLWRKQLPLLFLVAFGLLVALFVSPVIRSSGFVSTLFWDAPFYIHPIITLALLIYVGLGLALTNGTSDQGWPIYLVLVALWILVVALEYSMILWLEIQVGARFSAARINLIAFPAMAVAIGATVLLHVNQLNRRLLMDLKERGIDPVQLQALEPHAGGEARRIVGQLVGLAIGATFVLFLADLIIGGTRLGLDVLGILAGLVIMSVLLVYSYNVLKKGPFLEGESALTSTSSRMERSDDEESPTSAGFTGVKGP